MKNNKKDSLSHLDDLKAGAAMDCTGLIPSDPQSQDEVESYQEMYNFRPVAENKKNNPPVSATDIPL